MSGTKRAFAVGAAIVGGGLAAVAVVWLVWAWWESRLPATYSVMDYAIPDDGGGPATDMGMAGHVHDGTSVADLRGPAGRAAAAIHAHGRARRGAARVGPHRRRAHVQRHRAGARAARSRRATSSR